MSDQPIPQEVDPVRGLVEALKKAGAALRAASQEHHQCAACRHAADRVDDALASYRAWEEGGGSDSAAAPGRSGASAPPEGWRLVPESAFRTTFEVVAYDSGGYGDNRGKTFTDGTEAVKYAESLESNFGATVWRRTTYVGQDQSEKLWPPAAALSAAPPPPAGVDRPETEGAKIAREDVARIVDPEAWQEASRLMALTWADKPATATARALEVLSPSLTKADQIIALLAQQKERG